jgi:hypothetical protein
MRRAELDAWLPDPSIRTRHRRTARAEPEVLWAAAEQLRLDQTRTIGRLVQWRIPSTPAGIGFRELLSTHPFAELDGGDGWSVSGLCGKIWTTADDYPRVDGEGFRAWDQGGTVRVLFAHWVEPGEAPGTSAIVSEARVSPVDRRAGWALRSLWLAVGPFERLIGAEPLSLVVRIAEDASS